MLYVPLFCCGAATELLKRVVDIIDSGGARPAADAEPLRAAVIRCRRSPRRATIAPASPQKPSLRGKKNPEPPPCPLPPLPTCRRLLLLPSQLPRQMLRVRLFHRLHAVRVMLRGSPVRVASCGEQVGDVHLVRRTGQSGGPSRLSPGRAAAAAAAATRRGVARGKTNSAGALASGFLRCNPPCNPPLRPWASPPPACASPPFAAPSSPNSSSGPGPGGGSLGFTCSAARQFSRLRKSVWWASPRRAPRA